MSWGKLANSRWMDRLLYIDRAVIVMNKPPGLVTQLRDPTTFKSEDEGNFAKLLDDLKNGLDMPYIPYRVHRLDKATTGCLVLARSHGIARDLSTQFRQRTVEKTYLALVRGGRQSFSQTTGQIRVPVRYVDGRASLVPREQANEKDKDAATDWELVASSSHLPLSLLRLKPLTGYKHQLRIHLAQVLKTPILGDTLYSQSEPTDEIRNAVNLPDDRMFLHASQISFYRYRPVGSQKRFRIRIYAPLPPDFFRICAEESIPVGEFERLGGLFVHRRKNHDFQYVADNEIPEVDGYWKPQPDLNA